MNELRQIARVDDKDLAGQASGAGARALLAAVLAEEPVPEASPRRWRRVPRWVPAVLITALLVTGVVVGPSIVNGRNATSYANSAIEVWREGDMWKARVRDPFANEAEFEEAFHAVGLDMTLEFRPAAPREVGRLFKVATGVGSPGDPGVISTGEDPEGCRLVRPGCTLLLSFSDNADGAHFTVGRPARPGESYADGSVATAKGGSLAGLRVDEKTVGEVVPQVERRGLKVTYLIITVPPGNPGGYSVDPAGQHERVGRDWFVWEAEEAAPGVVRLLVTDRRYDRNPVYGGPRDAVIHD